MSRTTFASMESAPTSVANTKGDDPPTLTVPPITKSPERFTTGIDSPVSALSSARSPAPDTTRPSAGNRAPGATREYVPALKQRRVHGALASRPRSSVRGVGGERQEHACLVLVAPERVLRVVAVVAANAAAFVLGARGGGAVGERAPRSSGPISTMTAAAGCSAASARMASEVLPLARASSHLPMSTNEMSTALVSKKCASPRASRARRRRRRRRTRSRRTRRTCPSRRAGPCSRRRASPRATRARRTACPSRTARASPAPRSPAPSRGARRLAAPPSASVIIASCTAGTRSRTIIRKNRGNANAADTKNSRRYLSASFAWLRESRGPPSVSSHSSAAYSSASMARMIVRAPTAAALYRTTTLPRSRFASTFSTPRRRPMARSMRGGTTRTPCPPPGTPARSRPPPRRGSRTP